MNTQSPPGSKPFHAGDGTTSDIETEVRTCYSVLTARVSANAPITVLHIGTEITGIASGSGSQSPATCTLEIGSKKTARDYFRHAPPTPVEIENAIAAVEDGVAHARKMIATGSTLFTMDAAIRDIAVIAGVPETEEIVLTLDAIEQTFERLAAVTLGRPASREVIPTSNEFAATLLILREFMHHLQFQLVTVKK